MNPFWWLLWAAGAAVILFVVTAGIAAFIDSIREHKPCEKCGHVKGRNGNKERVL